MIASGFYYTGCGDCVTCFHCGITLRNWAHADDVDMEHKKNILLSVNIFLCLIKFELFMIFNITDNYGGGTIYWTNLE